MKHILEEYNCGKAKVYWVFHISFMYRALHFREEFLSLQEDADVNANIYFIKRLIYINYK